MNKSWIIMKREFLTRVKTKGFIFGTFVAPILMVCMIILPGVLMQMSPQAETTIAIADFTGKLTRNLIADIEENKNDDKEKSLYRIVELKADLAGLDTLKQRMNKEILSGKTDVFLIFPPEIFETNWFELYAKNIGNFQLDRTNCERGW